MASPQLTYRRSALAVCHSLILSVAAEIRLGALLGTHILLSSFHARYLPALTQLQKLSPHPSAVTPVCALRSIR